MTQQGMTEDEKAARIKAIIEEMLNDPQVIMKTSHRIELEWLLHGEVRIEND